MGKRNKGTSVNRVFEEAPNLGELGTVDQEKTMNIPTLGEIITPSDPMEELRAEVSSSDPGEDNTLSFVLTEDHFDDNPELAMAGLNIGDVIEVDKFDAVMVEYEGPELATTEKMEKHATIDTFYKDLVHLLVRRNATGESMGIPLEYLENFNTTTGYFTGIKFGDMTPEVLKARISYCTLAFEDLVDMIIEDKGIRSTFRCVPLKYDILKVDGLSVAHFSASGSLDFTNLLNLQTGTLRTGL